jgi:hypothetical protein
VLLHQLRIEHAGDDNGEIGHREAILAQEIHPHDVIIDHNELLRLGQRARAHLECGKAADRHSAVERPFDVLGGDRRSVLKGRVLLQLEGGGHVADIHVVGELHLELVALVVLHAVGQRLHLVADEPVVAVPRDLVARYVRAHPVNVDVVGSALGNDEERLLA